MPSSDPNEAGDARVAASPPPTPSPPSSPEVGTPSADPRVAIAPLQAAQRVWIGTHFDPDGDAIGSLLGLGAVLEAAGKSVTFACADAAPQEVAFLSGVGRIVDEGPDPTRHDLAVAVDAGDASRLGNLYRPETWSSLPTLVIDHHVSNDGFGDTNFIDSSAASTAEMLVALIDIGRLPLDVAAATSLLTGIVTDTIGFRTPNVTVGTMDAARRLMALGAPLAAITQHVFYTRPLGGLKLLGHALDGVIVDGPFALTALTLDDLARAGVGAAEARGISAVLATAAEPRAIAVLRERRDGNVDVSLRAKPGTDLVPAAEAMGGGGHALAAGARIAGPLNDAIEVVQRALHTHVRIAGQNADVGGEAEPSSATAPHAGTSS